MPDSWGTGSKRVARDCPSMRKQELVHLHGLFAAVRSYLREREDVTVPAEAFDPYDEHGVGPDGSIYGFLGPNGAGKSTTINMLLDFVRPTAGSVRVLGRDAQADSVARTRPSTTRRTATPPRRRRRCRAAPGASRAYRTTEVPSLSLPESDGRVAGAEDASHHCHGISLPSPLPPIRLPVGTGDDPAEPRPPCHDPPAMGTLDVAGFPGRARRDRPGTARRAARQRCESRRMSGSMASVRFATVTMRST